VLRFEQGGFSAVDHDVAKKLIWEQEHRTAFEQANLEAHLQFCLCPKCGRRVCDECIDIEKQREGICKDCAKENLESKPV